MPDATAKTVSERLLTAADCARRTGVTVRALRVYERHGLIRPRRTEKGWRLYGAAEMERLGAILALKALGLPLGEIARLLARGGPSLDRLLEAQAKAWRVRQEEAEQGLRLAETALACARQSGSLTLDMLCDLVRRMTMSEVPTTMKQVMDELYTPQEQAEWAARKMHIPAEEVRRVEAAWTDLIADIHRMMAAGVDPASPEGQQAAARWRELTQAFYQGDAEEMAKGGQMWRMALDRDPQGAGLPFGKDVWDWIGKAAAKPDAG